MTNQQIPTTLPTGTWQLDPAATTVTVTAKKLLLWAIPATLAIVDGTIEIDDAGEVVAVQVVADAGSYASKNAKRNEHVVGPDFLDAAEHPTITFGTDSVTRTTDGLRADGTVSIKGRTAPLAVAISDLRVEGDTATFGIAAAFDRRPLGVDKMPGIIVGNELTLTVSATAAKA